MAHTGLLVAHNSREKARAARLGGVCIGKVRHASIAENSSNCYAFFYLGNPVSKREERIRGCLKYTWMEGPSIAMSVRLQKLASQTSPGAAPSTPSTVRLCLDGLNSYH